MPKKNTASILIFGILIITVTVVFFWITSAAENEKLASDGIVSRKGLHLHPILNIYIKGQLQTLPIDVGLGVVHQPIHTHDADNKVHLEFSGLVTIKDTMLGEFFRIWGKQFNSNCVFDNCNGPSGTVKMFVNGQINNDFENYPMKDEDKIEIRYE